MLCSPFVLAILGSVLAALLPTLARTRCSCAGLVSLSRRRGLSMFRGGVMVA